MSVLLKIYIYIYIEKLWLQNKVLGFKNGFLVSQKPNQTDHIFNIHNKPLTLAPQSAQTSKKPEFNEY